MAMNKIKDVKHLKIYPEPQEVEIVREHWRIFAEVSPHDTDCVEVMCEMMPTFFDASIDDTMIGDKLRADLCAALDDFELDLNKCSRSCFSRNGLTQYYCFTPNYLG